MVMTAMMTKALTDSLTRPLAEERAGNVGRTLCCRASWYQQLRHDDQDDQEDGFREVLTHCHKGLDIGWWKLTDGWNDAGRWKTCSPRSGTVSRCSHIVACSTVFNLRSWGFSSCLPAHDVHDVQLDFLSEINLDIADYQKRVLIAKQIINSVYF